MSKFLSDNRVSKKAVWEDPRTIDEKTLISPEIQKLIQHQIMNTVSEKAVWEGDITSDNDTPYLGSQMQAQPQMMFCYKCNNVIPADSKFCPYCQIELYVICPKCGVKYSSQYPICNQCGTNRQEYLKWQREEETRRKNEEFIRRRFEESERLRKEKEAEEEANKQSAQIAYNNYIKNKLHIEKIEDFDRFGEYLMTAGGVSCAGVFFLLLFSGVDKKTLEIGEYIILLLSKLSILLFILLLIYRLTCNFLLIPLCNFILKPFNELFIKQFLKKYIRKHNDQSKIAYIVEIHNNTCKDSQKLSKTELEELYS